MRRNLIILIIIILFLLSCTERKFNNPAEPNLVSETLKAPTNLSIYVADENILELTWDDNSETEDRFLIYRSINAEDYKYYKTIPANTTIWQDSKVELGKTYAYRIYAANEDYISVGAAESVFVYSLFSPSDFKIEALDGNKIRLSWIDNNHFEEGYQIDRKTGNSQWEEAFATVPADSTFWECIEEEPYSPPYAWRVGAYYKKLKSTVTKEVSLSVANPIFSVESGDYQNVFAIVISCETADAQIHYTVDGSMPTINSPISEGTMRIDSNTTLKVKAFKSGWHDSDLITGIYSFTVANPTISHSSGTYANPQSVSISCATPGAQIRYTTDGSIPTHSSALYSGAIQVESNTSLKVKAFRAGWGSSETISEMYLFKVATPAFSLPSGVYNTPQSVSISCETPESTIRYTLDGSTPTQKSTQFTEPILVNENTTINAIAYKDNWVLSSMSTVSYTLKTQTVADPVLSPLGGIYASEQTVSINCATYGATIYYTTDGSTPTTSSNIYQNAIIINSNVTIKTKAFKDKMYDSDVVVEHYILKATSPTFSPAAGEYVTPKNVSINCDTDGATIYYTTDGSEPTDTSTIYDEEIYLESNTIIKAKAFKEGWTESFTESSGYFFYPPAMIYINGGSFTMGDTRGVGGTNELPLRTVTLNDFLIGNYPITQGEYQEIMGHNPASEYGVGVDYPVYNVSWFDAVKYCNYRSIDEGLMPYYEVNYSTNPDDWTSSWSYTGRRTYSNGYRLPTEAEWEYAARGASNYPDYLYSGSENIDEVAWYIDNSDGASRPVRLKTPNSLGLYDMSGNIAEWCYDWWGYYQFAGTNNPTGPASGRDRVSRGGYWNSGATDCRVTSRAGGISEARGFRVCKNVPYDRP